ncbi:MULTISPECIES: carbamate kinase [unclassified Mesorhizobium]|uniref:carbamate kinase n=2 Tax=Mesorhizobium TaxID=68287 RepID=UPI000F75D05A|nr:MULTISPECIES: carbamate kinase [unclassified Mesorhizobium]AZO05458.1 carbamate kinase [Mesorhizobium sp. M2A.F.Ca.ET.043.02.1.1]RUW40802.1 carbamate kinase [Mesorhizobium sp. M2A.F.Ca.ET.015.02.1.1]RUW80819.1 carbamate kinase [Mesorhizobium sp. M2A.F.Ca.ET.067.02.1.1]RVD11806.1 carbamate kinase [Mesorhizobium sp. M2A.F.Ca.ET.029.05.1.1]RWB49197.1 MAG: carbamate kinase [Mesorhizobium sp.]
MLIVAALGGNALLRRGEPMTAENQRGNVKHAASALAALIGQGHSLVITHGNGPQVGLLALQSAASTDGAFPLDVLGAESAGMIGYMIEQELANLISQRLFATLLTQVKVDPGDPAFAHPTKPIGPVYDEATARRLVGERGWTVAPDGDKWRRVVPSPRPLDILEVSVISYLVEQGVVVICTGGGGVPVIARDDGSMIGVEAVIDKDLASSLVARQLKADMLLMLTDVDAVYAGFGTPQARALRHVATTEISGRNFPAGSMGPKVGAAIEFAEATGKPAAIGKLEDALAIVRGERGTWLEAPAKELQNS